MCTVVGYHVASDGWQNSSKKYQVFASNKYQVFFSKKYEMFSLCKFTSVADKTGDDDFLWWHKIEELSGTDGDVEFLG